MSGGSDPSSDIGLPEEQQSNQTSFPKNNQTPHTRKRFFSFRHRSALAVVVVLAFSGMVSVEDFVFVVCSLIYMYFISKVSFPSLSSSMEPPVFGQSNKFLGPYVLIGALIGLFLPIAYICEGIFKGDKEGIKAAAPHLFLLSSQVFMEGVTFSGKFSLPIRVFVPVFYNSRRIFTIVDWLRSEISKVDEGYGGGARRLYFGRGIAIANMAFWCFNLFGFLLPVYLPKAFKIYYSGYKVKN